MGIDSISNNFYNLYSEQITPICMMLLGLTSFFLCYPGIPPTEYESILVAVAGLYMFIESLDEFMNRLCEYKLQQDQGNSYWTSQLIQLLSLLFTMIGFILFIIILIAESDDDMVVIEVVIMMIIGVFRMCETLMEVYYMKDARDYVKLMYNIQDKHLMSVIRDAYRVYLRSTSKKPISNHDKKDALENRSTSEKPFPISNHDKKDALENINAIQELPDVVLTNLCYEQRVKIISDILSPTPISDIDEYNGHGTNANIWNQFNIKVNSEEKYLQAPKELLECLESVCPFSNDITVKVKHSHIWCFIPGNCVDLKTGEKLALTASVLGEYCENFIPGVGVIWRYLPDIKSVDFDGKSRWILMYKGEEGNGIVPSTLDKTWDESIGILAELNKKCIGAMGAYVEYDTMTLLEVIACTYTHFVQTGKIMYHEKFTRVKEQTNSKCSTGRTPNHLFIGRFNMSGLNNDAYLDVGGDEGRFHLRGLSVCKRFICS